MKKLSFFLIFFLILTTVFGQNLVYKLTVVNNKQSPVSGLTVFVKEKSTKEKILKKTDSYGKVTFELETGSEWIVNIGELYNHKVLMIPENGMATQSEFLTYDMEAWNKENRVLPDRSLIVFEKFSQTNTINTKPTDKESIVILEVKDNLSKPLTGFYISLTDLAGKKIYTAKTDYSGRAIFKVPFNKVFEIDIDGIESFMDVSTPESPGIFTMQFTYQPTNIKEKNSNDTITQIIPKELAEGTSSHILYTITVNFSSSQVAANENVYLRMIKSNIVYKGTTDNEGNVTFLLPKKKNYLLDFDFQKDVDVVDLSHSYKAGIGYGSMKITYIPDPKLQYPEKYIPSSEDLLINEFNNFLTKQYPKPEKGLSVILNWGNTIVNKNSKTAILELGISATNDRSNSYGPPVNISFVMDKSGSMAGYDRIEELKISLSKFVKLLRPQDIASLIIFESEPEILIEAGKMEGKQNEFLSLIKSVEAGGGTNIYKAMILGYEEILKNMIPKGTNKLILLTDGYGETEPKIVLNKSKEYNDKGILISAIGVGRDYNQPLLKLLTEQGGGTFQHIENSYNLEQSFDNELTSLLFPVASNVKIDIIYNDKIVFNQLFGFPCISNSNNTTKVNIDNIYPGYNKLAIIKFDLNQIDKSIEEKPIIVKISYFDLNSKTNMLIEQKIFLKWEDSDSSKELIYEAELKKLYAIAIMNQTLKVMADAFSVNDFVKAETAVNRGIEQINELYTDIIDNEVKLIFKTLKSYSLILRQYRLNKYIKKTN